MDVREVTYQLTHDDLSSANRWVLMGRGQQCRLVSFCMGVAIALFIFDALNSDRPLSSAPVCLVTGFCMLISYEIFSLIYVTIASRWSFFHQEKLRIPYTLTWGEAKFEWVSERTRHAYSLRDLKRWAEKEDKFFIHTNDNMLWIIHKSFFKKPEDIQSLRNELSQTKS